MMNLEIKCSCFTFIFGYINEDQNHIPINSLILVTKKCICDTSRDGKRLILKPLKLNSLLRDEEYCDKLNEKESFLMSGIGGHLYLGVCTRIIKNIEQNEDVCIAVISIINCQICGV